MSWDVLIMNYHGKPPKFEEIVGDPEPLGPAEEVRQAISAALPGVDWTNPTWGLYGGDGFTFEFNSGAEDPISTIMVHVRGSGNAVESLYKLAVPTNWSLLDCSTSEFLDLQNPSRSAWKDFQAYRDKIIESYRDEVR